MISVCSCLRTKSTWEEIEGGIGLQMKVSIKEIMIPKLV